jgi:hypothetical protein
MIRRTDLRFLLIAAAVLGSGAVFVPASFALAQWNDRGVPGPSPRGEFGFAFDSNADIAVLFGGASSLNFAAVNGQTWTWNSAAWTFADSTGMTARCDNAMAYDSVRNRVVSYGGYNGTYLGDTWKRVGGAWTQITGATPPSPRADSFMAFDSQHGVMVLFGGQGSTGVIRRDTWEFGDSTWTQRAANGPPPARWIHRMAYDSVRGVTVMFGGAAPNSLLADTWEWDGTTWTENTTPGPSARYGHAMAFDSANEVAVLFGGQSLQPFGQGVLGDTWTYDGTTWTQLAISGPSPRSFVKMVYDSARNRIVLFGGWNGTQMVDDTWELVLDAQTSVENPEGAARWVLAPNVPNPFHEVTEIRYSLPSDGLVSISIYDAGGALVRNLLQQTQSAGPHSIVWNGLDSGGRRAASGTYFYRLEAGEKKACGRMVLLR